VEGLTRVLAPVEGMKLVSWCKGLDDLRSELETHRPDLLLVDMTSEVTFNVLRGLHEAGQCTRIVLWVHTISSELALQAMSLGVRGILRRTLPAESVVRCMLCVNAGELWFEKTLTDSIMGARRYALTRREGQLIALLSQGLKNKEISAALHISEGTVKVYLSKLFQKLGVKDRFELALYGLKNLAPAVSALEGPSSGLARKPPAPVWHPPRSFFVERTPPKTQIPARSLIPQAAKF
jgi:DNA-binding NarL/FixJ family response regulator